MNEQSDILHSFFCRATYLIGNGTSKSGSTENKRKGGIDKESESLQDSRARSTLTAISLANGLIGGMFGLCWHRV